MLEDAVTVISSAIRETLLVQRRTEQWYSPDPDRTDDTLKNCSRRVTILRTIREQLEDELSQAL